MKTIKLPYTPSITNEKVMEILKKEYPDKKVSKLINLVRIKGNPLRVANIKVFHSEKKNLTQIDVWLAFPFWMGLTIMIPILFVGLWIYSLGGNWANEVCERLKVNFGKN